MRLLSIWLDQGTLVRVSSPKLLKLRATRSLKPSLEVPDMREPCKIISKDTLTKGMKTWRASIVCNSQSTPRVTWALLEIMEFMLNSSHRAKQWLIHQETLVAKAYPDTNVIDTIYNTLNQQVDDRALHKRYLEERDFSNKTPYLKNFTGDPFLHLHEART